MSAWPRNHAGYELVPLPSVEERMYPSLERNMPAPVVPDVVVAAPPPSAPVFGALQHPPQAPMIFTSAAAAASSSVPFASPVGRPDAGNYVPLPHEEPGALAQSLSQPVLAPPADLRVAVAAASGQPNQSAAALEQRPPTWQEMEERLKTLPRATISIQSLFHDSWRVYTRNLCYIFGAEVLITVLLVIIFIIQVLISVAIVGHNNYRYMWAVLVLSVLFSWLVYGPVILSLFYAIYRGIMFNSPVHPGNVVKFFARQYCSLLPFSFFSTLVAMIPSVFSIVVAIAFYTLFGLAIPFRLQFPLAPTFKPFRFALRVAARNFCTVFGLTLLIVLMNGLALLAFGVGLLVTLPLSFGINVYLYHRVVGLHSVTGYTFVEGRGEEYDSSGNDPEINPAPRAFPPAAPLVPLPRAPVPPQQYQVVHFVPMQGAVMPNGMAPPMVMAPHPNGGAPVMFVHAPMAPPPGVAGVAARV